MNGSFFGLEGDERGAGVQCWGHSCSQSISMIRMRESNDAKLGTFKSGGQCREASE